MLWGDTYITATLTERPSKERRNQTKFHVHLILLGSTPLIEFTQKRLSYMNKIWPHWPAFLIWCSRANGTHVTQLRLWSYGTFFDLYDFKSTSSDLSLLTVCLLILVPLTTSSSFPLWSAVRCLFRSICRIINGLSTYIVEQFQFYPRFLTYFSLSPT